MIGNPYLLVILVLLVLVGLSLYRVIYGPGTINRIVAANVVGTKSIAVLLLTGFVFERLDMFVDISLAYALINFLGTLAFSKYFIRKGIG